MDRTKRKTAKEQNRFFLCWIESRKRKIKNALIIHQEKVEVLEKAPRIYYGAGTPGQRWCWYETQQSTIARPRAKPDQAQAKVRPMSKRNCPRDTDRIPLRWLETRRGALVIQNLNIYIYTFDLYIYMCVCIYYVYIHREREPERERALEKCITAYD